MTVNVPTNEKSGAAAIAAKITTLSTRTDSQSVQALNQTQTELVQVLLDQRRLIAATVISTMPASIKRGPIYGQITAQNALITSYGNGPQVSAAQQTLDSLQRQLVIEEMASGARTAASILSTMSYSGGAAQ